MIDVVKNAGKGQHMKQLGEENRAKVRAWFKENPGKTMADCARALELSYAAVRGHVTALLDECSTSRSEE